MSKIFEIIFKGTGLDSLQSSLKSKLATLVSLGAAWRVAKDSFDDYLEKQRGLTDLDSGLRKAGLATAEYRQRIIDLADQMEETAGVADEKFLAAMGRLTREGMKPDQLNAMAEGLKNLSVLMGDDVNGAAMMLGKAMNGNFETFSRMGIKVDNLNDLLEELAKRGGSLAEDRMNTLEGQMKNLQNAVDDLQVSLVTAMGNLTGFATAGDKGVESLKTIAAAVRGAGALIEDASKNKLVKFAHDLSLIGIASNLASVGIKMLADKGKDLDGFEEGLGKIFPTAKDAAQGLKDLADAGEEAADQAERVKDGYNAAADAIERMKRMEQELADVEEERAQAEIDLKEATGELSPEQARTARDAARDSGQARKLAIEEKAAKDSLNVAKAQIQVQGATPEAEAAVAQAENTLKVIGGRRAVLDTRAKARGAMANRETEARAAADGAKAVEAAAAAALTPAEPMITVADAIAAINAARGRKLSATDMNSRTVQRQIQAKLRELQQTQSASRD